MQFSVQGGGVAGACPNATAARAGIARNVPAIAQAANIFRMIFASELPDQRTTGSCDSAQLNLEAIVFLSLKK
jgi:hypothetical protein